MNREGSACWVIVCYTAELLALAIWIGGLVVIVAAVIPAVFNSFAMEPGGRFLTRVFNGYNRLVLAGGGVLAISAVLRTTMTRRFGVMDVALPRVEWTVLLVMIAV